MMIHSLYRQRVCVSGRRLSIRGARRGATPRPASKEFGDRGISVIAIGPGPMDTPSLPGVGRLVDDRVDHSGERRLHHEIVSVIFGQ
jgi:hypothetical protein